MAVSAFRKPATTALVRYATTVSDAALISGRFDYGFYGL